MIQYYLLFWEQYYSVDQYLFILPYIWDVKLQQISKVTAGDEIEKEVIDITEMLKTITKEFAPQLEFANMK